MLAPIDDEEFKALLLAVRRFDYEFDDASRASRTLGQVRAAYCVLMRPVDDVLRYCPTLTEASGEIVTVTSASGSTRTWTSTHR